MMGNSLIPLMTEEQLRAATEYYIRVGPRDQMMVGYRHVKQVMANHWRSCLKMPAGGGHAGGGQQSGFEMTLVSAVGVRKLFQGWPNYQQVRLGHSWECRTMEECSSVCAFAARPAGWGALNGKPIPRAPGSTEHLGVLLVGPPCTAVWRMRSDATTTLTLRFPVIIHMGDATILPPDDASGVPFYVDPPEQPGMHRDLFRAWGQKVVGELHTAGYSLDRRLLQYLPREYLSAESSEEEG